jgi:glycosyltransferase involved in cell wall biosynthesis
MSTLSFCIVAHNEDEVFGKSLESIQQVADEIVILFEPETNKKTVKIAKKYTQNIYFEKLQDWSTSFMLVNNLATSDYVINWDADFVLRDGSEKTLTDLKQANFYGLDSIVLNWNIEFNKNYIKPMKWVKRKLIHKKGQYTFVHPLHPRHVFQGKNQEKVAYYPDIEVDHYNTYQGRKPRYERFLKIMATEVEQHPYNAESLFYYGEELIFAKNFELALEIWLRYFDVAHVDPLHRLVFAIQHVSHVYLVLNKCEAGLELIQKYQTTFAGTSATFDLIYCDMLVANNHYEQAALSYQTIIKKYSESEDWQSCDLTDVYRLKQHPYRMLEKLTAKPI